MYILDFTLPTPRKYGKKLYFFWPTVSPKNQDLKKMFGKVLKTKVFDEVTIYLHRYFDPQLLFMAT